MWREDKKVINITILLFLVCFIGTGCTNQPDAKRDSEDAAMQEEIPAWQKYAGEPVDFDWYINYSWFTTGWGENIVSKKITEETGVNIHFITPSGNESEKLNALIAAD